MSDSTNDPKLAKADAKAAKARAKALRPWFKKKRFILPIALVVIIGLSQAMNGGGSDSGSSTSAGGDTSSESSSNDRAAIGTPAVDGKFSFTVTAIKCGIKSVGSSSFGQEAQGQFCQVSLNIENVGDEAQTMFADSQKLFDSEGREFSADTSSMIYLEGASDTWLKEINPGNTLKGSILFDIPADATPDYIELHDSMFSGGVEVSLK